MANAIIAYGNQIDTATLSGGSWLSTLPLANLQDRRLGKLARTTDDATASTKFDLDFGGPRLLRVVGLIGHNFSPDALYRIRLSTVADFATTVADSGWTAVWPVAYPFGTLPWGSPSWWTGSYSAEDVASYDASTVYVAATTVSARYMRVEIDDTTNAAGYVEFGRLFAGDGWQPIRNMVYGAGVGWESRTTVQEALSGAESFDVRRSVRIARFGLEAMTESEAMAAAYEIQRSMGISGEVLFVWDADDTANAPRRRFLGRFRTLSAIENPGPDRWRAPFEIKELL